MLNFMIWRVLLFPSDQRKLSCDPIKEAEEEDLEVLEDEQLLKCNLEREDSNQINEEEPQLDKEEREEETIEEESEDKQEENEEDEQKEVRAPLVSCSEVDL